MCRALFSGYLSQVVKAQSGRTAMQWLETFTIWQAGHLLRNSPRMSIKEVAYALRFPDQPGCSGVISGARRGQLALGLPRGGFRRARGGHAAAPVARKGAAPRGGRKEKPAASGALAGGAGFFFNWVCWPDGRAFYLNRKNCGRP